MRPLWAEHPPHLGPCSLVGARPQAVPKTVAGAAVPVLAGLRARRPAGVMPAKRRSAMTASTPGALPAGSTGGFQGATTWESGGWGCDAAGAQGESGVCRARGAPWAASPRAASLLPVPPPAPAASEALGEVEWGSCVFWCPGGRGNAPARPPACWISRRRAAAAVCFPALSPPSRSRGRWGRAGWRSRYLSR